MGPSNIYALATAAEMKANEAIAQLGRVSTPSQWSNTAEMSTLNLRVDAKPDATPCVHGLTYDHKVMNKHAEGNRMLNPSFQKEQLQDVHVALPRVQAPTVAAADAPSNSRRKPSFVDKLFAILSNKYLANIITWLPSGKSFCILDKGKFVDKVLPLYFREVQFDSFSRRMKRWGFRKVYTTGLKQVTFTHDMFQKDRIDLLKKMSGRSEQAASSKAPQNVVVDAAKFEAAMTEQVALEKTLLARPFAAQKQERANVQMQASKPFVPFNQGVSDCTYDATVGANQGTFRFNEQPFLVGHEQKALFAPSQLQLQQTNLHEMSLMKMRSSPMASIMFGRSQVDPRLVPYQGQADTNVAMQLASLDDDIAECQEQLAILQRLRDLRERRRALDH